MRKATIFDINHKKDQQVADDVSMTPAERIDRMFELMEFADLHPSKTLLHHNPLQTVTTLKYAKSLRQTNPLFGNVTKKDFLGCLYQFNGDDETKKMP